MNYFISGNLVDVLNEKITNSIILIENGLITSITQTDGKSDNYIIPPFVDSHIHFESSMLTPSEFARTAAIHGTIGIVADPHEIANVAGMAGIRYFIEDAKKVPLKIFFGAPSCVPATDFESSGARITAKEIEELFKVDKLHFLGELMNFPGVLSKDNIVLDKINIAKKYGKVIDGHCPKLTEFNLINYIDAGISTDHETTTLSEAIEKILNGMKIQIRSGSAAKDFNQLYSLIDDYTDKLMFCSDDLEPADLKKGHINLLVKKAIAKGIDIIKVLKVASINPIMHYNLNIGMLRVGDPADFLVIDNFTDFNIIQTHCDGKLIAENGKTKLEYQKPEIINNFNTNKITPNDIEIKLPQNNENKESVLTNVIGITNSRIITKLEQHLLPVENATILPDLSQDIIKLVVHNRYKPRRKLAKAFVKGMQLQNIAIASSVAHDSHNIIAAGVNDNLICNAINIIVEAQGGIAVALNDETKILKLNIAGLMSDLNIEEVAKLKNELEDIVHTKGGCKLDAPFMTLSFLALLVIPEIKLSDKGLFNVSNFSFISNEV